MAPKRKKGRADAVRVGPAGPEPDAPAIPHQAPSNAKPKGPRCLVLLKSARPVWWKGADPVQALTEAWAEYGKAGKVVAVLEDDGTLEGRVIP